MFQRLNLLAALAAVALLGAATTAEATPRYKRLNHKPTPAAFKMPPEVEKAIKAAFGPKAKITGSWLEEKGEMEVFVTVPGSPPIEVVFRKKGGSWHLVGYEYPAPEASLTPKAKSALMAKYP